VKRFNHRYGDILKIPKAELNKVGSRIMSLSDPTKKMSKSDPKGNIDLNEPLASVKKKIMSAVTDSGNTIYFNPDEKPGISNLLTILASIRGLSIPEVELLVKDFSYGQFKTLVSDEVLALLTDLQSKYNHIIQSGYVFDVLEKGKKKAELIANATLNEVKKAIGLW
jgi:tryptophanyl-tRNA synthetase